MAGAEFEIPVTAPPVPVELNPVIVLLEVLSDDIVPLVPCDSPVITPCPVIFVIVLPVIVPGFPKLRLTAVIGLMPPVQLLNVFPVNVFVGVDPVPSVFDHPAMVVAPVTVIFEKLLLLFWCAVVEVDDPASL